MPYLALKAAISGIIVAAVSEIAKRYPGLGCVPTMSLYSLTVWLGPKLGLRF